MSWNGIQSNKIYKQMYKCRKYSVFLGLSLHLLSLIEVLWAKSSHFKRNPCDWEFCATAKDFPMQISLVFMLVTLIRPVELTNRNLLGLKVTSVWVVLHVSSCPCFSLMWPHFYFVTKHLPNFFCFCCCFLKKMW